MNNLYSIHPQVQRLNQLPRVIQRSEEWFMSRRMRITASEVASVLDVNPYKSKKTYWKEKLAVIMNEPDKDKKKNFSTEWGVKYEPVVQNMIRKRFQFDKECETLFEYGMICHPYIDYLGASPDGILFNGTMIEIKCTTTRELKENEIVPYYYSQVQTQMECCQLEQCEFIEAKFIEYKSMNEFIIDRLQDNYLLSCDDKYKGVLCDTNKNESQERYIYYDGSNHINDIKRWIDDIKKENPNSKIIFWKCDKMLNKIIKKNNEYVKYMLHEIKSFWDSLLKKAIPMTHFDGSVRKIDSEPEQFDDCSFLFENFVIYDIIVTYDKKEQNIQFTDTPNYKTSTCLFRI